MPTLRPDDLPSPTLFVYHGCITTIEIGVTVKITQEDLEYVGLKARLGASIIDALIQSVICIPLLLAFYGKAYFKGGGTKGSLDFFLNYIFPGIFTLVFWFWKQSTPGKMAMSARIVNATTGKKPSALQFVGRYFAYFLSALPLGLGFLWIAFDSKKRGFHDILAGTVVVRPKKRVSDVAFDVE